MTDEPAHAEPSTVDPLAVRLDRPLAELTVDELMALKDEFEERGIWVYNSLPPELWALLGLAAIYAKTFVETLAKRHADALEDLIETRLRKNGKKTEAEIGADDGSTAKIVVTADMPDEARLALVDLDVTDDAVRGKLLRWDGSASEWRPADDK